MKKYLAITFVGILLLAGCAKDQSPSSSATEKNTSPQSSEVSQSNPSSVEIQAGIFQKAVSERDPKQCEQITNQKDRENCLEAIKTIQKNSEGTTVPEKL